MTSIVALLALPLAAQEPGPQPGALLDAFRAGGIEVDLGEGWAAFEVEVLVRDELLEYLLVLPHGPTHESLLLTDVDPELLNAALLTLGAEPGRNAVWRDVDPPPTPEELQAGARPVEIELPSGDGFYLYVTWREDDEVYFHRAEDLVRDLERQRTMERHRWVFLGSRIVRTSQGEAFAATLEGGLVNIAFFSQGNTLITAALPQAEKQTIWLPNAWLLPERGHSARFLIARERLAMLPAALAESLPDASEESSDETPGEAAELEQGEHR